MPPSAIAEESKMTGAFRPAPPPVACAPPWWARGGHLQTLLGNFLPGSAPTHASRRIEVALADGDRLVGRESMGRSDVLVCFFHGLGGSNDADYMHRGVAVALGLGHGAWSFNHRGCGEGAGLAAGIYHSGRADDLGAVFAHARACHPGKRLLAVGFSLSGNALLLNLGEGIGRFEKPDLAIAVNPPIDLEKGARMLKRGLNRIYDLRFVLRCRRAVRERVAAGLIPDRYRVPLWSTLHDFDDAVTAPIGGFRDREDYYARCSAKPHLGKIDRPTVILAARDDPFIDWHDHVESPRSDLVHLHLEDSGGHMGYLSRNAPRLRWLNLALAHYVAELLRA